MQKRISKVKALLRKKALDAILISSVSNITYLTNFSSFSKDEREAYLLIVAQPLGLTHKTPGVIGYLITDGRYGEAVQLHIPHFTLIEHTVKNSVEAIFKMLSKKHKIKKLGIEENNITVSEQKLLKKCFNDLNHFSISSLRAIKDSTEINSIEKACKLGDKTFNYILKKIKKGITEQEIAFEIEHFIKKSGADISFPTIVAFGKNSSIPHHQTGKTELKSGDFVLLDFGVRLNNYCSDMTRTVFFGKPSNEQKKMYQTVLSAQKKTLETLHDISIYHASKNIDRVAREYILKNGFPTIPHSLGHGVGLEVHESPTLSPNSKDILKPGMVFSVEPGIYIKGFGGVRIEDLVVLEKSGPRLLTKSKREIIQV